jgi:parallel beta-helix repeat protein
MKTRLVKKSWCFAIILLFVGTSLVPSVMSGNTEKVPAVTIMDDDWYVKEGGNNSNSGESWEDALATISEAIIRAENGDIIYVGNGTYYENVIIEEQLTIEGNGSGVSIIDGGGDDNVVEINTKETNLSRFTIKNSRMDSDYAGVRIAGSNDVDIFNNTIHNNSKGIRCTSSNNIDIVYNTIYNNNLDGMHFEGCDVINILHNKIYDCGKMGIFFPDNCYNISIIKNTIDNINLSGIELHTDCDNVDIINNNINNTGESGVSFYYSYGKNNLIMANNISNCGVEGIEIFGGSVEITYNQIYGNGFRHRYGAGIFIGGRSVKELEVRRNHIYNNKQGIFIATMAIKHRDIRENNIVNDNKTAILLRINETLWVFIQHNWWGEQTPLNYWDRPWKRMVKNLSPIVIFFPWSNHEWDCTPP